MGDVSLSVNKLLLDELNPRHRAVTTQEAALNEVMRRGGPVKLLNLARDIAATGLSPIDRLIVMKSDTVKGKYVVLEGNRRLAALRLLATPERCPDSGLLPKFEALAAVAEHKPKTVRCYEVGSRAEARPLLARRHGGEMDGVGVVRWSAMQRTRNSTTPGHQERLALVTLDWLDNKSEVGSNRHLAELLDEVAEEKFTTFGRLVADPDFRFYCGFEIKGDLFTVTDSGESVVVRLSMVLEDFRGDRRLTVSELKSKAQREDYIKTLRERMAGADEVDEDPDDQASPDDATADDGSAEDRNDDADSQDTQGGAAGEEAEPAPKPPPMKLFVGASLSNCTVRLRRILHEVQSIPLNKYPNSAAALIRMVIELAVMEAHDVCGWPPPPERDKALRDYVRNSMRQLDPTGKAERYLALRQQISKKDSLINTVTLNAFLHNPAYLPSAPDMREISDTYSILLTDLNRAIGEAKDPSA